MPGLGRLYAPDHRDGRFPLSLAPRPRATTRSYRYWRLGEILDQGQTPMCVGFSWRQWLSSAPIMEKRGPSPEEIYAEAQQVDEYAGPPPDYDGTSVRAGAKVLQTLGAISAYHWASTAEELADWILNGGGAVLGTSWYDAMFNPDRNGFVAPGGSVVGGHAYFCDGYSQRKGAFKFANSWGTGWCLNGRFWMTGESVARLLSEQGEACCPIESRLK